MAVAKAKKAAKKAGQNGSRTIDLDRFRAGLSEEGQVLFDLAMSIPRKELMSDEEFRIEMARRRGGIVLLEK